MLVLTRRPGEGVAFVIGGETVVVALAPSRNKKRTATKLLIDAPRSVRVSRTDAAAAPQPKQKEPTE